LSHFFKIWRGKCSLVSHTGSIPVSLPISVATSRLLPSSLTCSLPLSMSLASLGYVLLPSSCPPPFFDSSYFLTTLSPTQVSSPACTELESLVLEMLGKLIGLPTKFLFEGGVGGGVIQGTASEAVLVCLLSAKERAWRRHRHLEEWKEHQHFSSPPCPSSFTSRLVCYSSDQAHSCVKKACMIAGIEYYRPLSTNEDLELEGSTLENAMKEDQERGLIPFFVVATLGTTSTTAFDRLDEIGLVCEQRTYGDSGEDKEEEGVWLHVDAAFAGASFVCPEQRHWLKGIERATSFDFNPHKWLLTSFDCSTLWTCERNALVNALSITPEYLRNPATESGSVVDYKDWQLPLGRRFRALKLWFMLRTYGTNKLQEYIRHHFSLAQLFEDLVKNDSRFQLSCQRTSTLVCFRLKPPSDSEKEATELNKRLGEELNESGKLFLSHTVIRGRYILRFAINGYHTTEQHVRQSWFEVQQLAQNLLLLRSSSPSSPSSPI
jgi:aromatic-L-amino-acid decarboxylase